MKTIRLSFEQLLGNVEFIEKRHLKNIKGGTDPEETEWGTVDGIVYRRTPGGEWEYYGTLSEVVAYIQPEPTTTGGIGWSNLFSLSGSIITGFIVEGLYNNNGGGGSGSTPSLYTFDSITIPETLQDIAESVFEDIDNSPAFATYGYLKTAYDMYIITANSSEMSTGEFSYKLAVIAAGAVSIWAQLGIQGYVEFAVVMAKAYTQVNSMTRQWFYDRMHPTDPNAFFSPIDQDVRDEWEDAANNP